MEATYLDLTTIGAETNEHYFVPCCHCFDDQLSNVPDQQRSLVSA